jgi:ATP-dependent helicase/DNAse subunit B
VARDWLRLELERAPFEVVAREEKMDLFAGDLKLSGRIDRMDRLASGGLAVIDYKSNRISLNNAWLVDAPEDMQLPLYALSSAEGDVRAVTFARLKTGDRGFSGLASDAQSAMPGVLPFQKHKDAKKRADTWSALFDFWRAEIEKLGVGFAAGDARVDPKQLLRTCERCDLKALCRVHERLGALEEGEEFAEASAEEEEE